MPTFRTLNWGERIQATMQSRKTLDQLMLELHMQTVPTWNGAVMAEIIAFIMETIDPSRRIQRAFPELDGYAAKPVIYLSKIHCVLCKDEKFRQRFLEVEHLPVEERAVHLGDIIQEVAPQRLSNSGSPYLVAEIIFRIGYENFCHGCDDS